MTLAIPTPGAAYVPSSTVSFMQAPVSTYVSPGASYSPFGISYPPAGPSYPYRTFPGLPLEPFTLVFITGNISLCSGCLNHYQKPIVPPFDVCVKHTEWRSFSVDGTPKRKLSPAYYHVNCHCIQSNWPLFFS